SAPNRPLPHPFFFAKTPCRGRVMLKPLRSCAVCPTLNDPRIFGPHQILSGYLPGIVLAIYLTFWRP
ncbi:MAG: hypothetical protein ACRETE_03390, partial [Stenotrophobium sp.]